MDEYFHVFTSEWKKQVLWYYQTIANNIGYGLDFAQAWCDKYLETKLFCKYHNRTYIY